MKNNDLYNYFKIRFSDIKPILKCDIPYYCGIKTLYGSNIIQGDVLLVVCIIHENNLHILDANILVHFKWVALRELSKLSNDYYLLKEQREPIIVNCKCMENETIKNKLINEYYK